MPSRIFSDLSTRYDYEDKSYERTHEISYVRASSSHFNTSQDERRFPRRIRHFVVTCCNIFEIWLWSPRNCHDKLQSSILERTLPLGWWRGGIVFVHFCAFLHVLLYTRSCTCTIMNRYPPIQLHFLLHYIFDQLTCFISVCLTRSRWDTSPWSDRCSAYIVEIILFDGRLLLWKILQNLRMNVCDNSATVQEMKDLRTEF